jgi:hypothetical protein
MREKSRILTNRGCRSSLSPEGSGICGGADLGEGQPPLERGQEGDGKSRRGEERRGALIGEGLLRSPVEEEHGDGRLEASPLPSPSTSPEESDWGFPSRPPESRTVLWGNGVEGPGSTPLMDNQTVPWAVPGQFGPRIVLPGKIGAEPLGGSM